MSMQSLASGTSMSVFSPEEKAYRGLEYLRDALMGIVDQRQSLLKSEQRVFELMPQRRVVKIQQQISTEDGLVPELTIKGKWLEEAGYHCSQDASIFVVQGMLLVCPQSLLAEQEAEIS